MRRRPLGVVTLSLNLWRVSDAAGEAPDTWLRIDLGEFQLWRHCGMISGSWSATDTLFLASVTSSGDACTAAGAVPTVDWLEGASTYRRTGAGWELAGANGAPLATLTIDGAPKPITSVAEFYTQPPVVTNEVRTALGPPAGLPRGSAPATAAFLRGRWVPADRSFDTHPQVTFDADGSWTGSDGCNGSKGRWAVDDHGRLLTTSGFSTEIGCAGAPVPSWVATARRAASDGDRLVLLGQDGADLGRLTRS